CCVFTRSGPMVDLKASRERALAAFRNLPPRDGRA
ncbi:hypothetical protein, partial [Pseudomonas aeruginosa]